MRTRPGGSDEAHTRIADAFARLMAFAWCGFCIDPTTMFRAATAPIVVLEGVTHTPDDAAAVVRAMRLSSSQVRRQGRVVAWRSAAAPWRRASSLPPAALRGLQREPPHPASLPWSICGSLPPSHLAGARPGGAAGVPPEAHRAAAGAAARAVVVRMAGRDTRGGGHAAGKLPDAGVFGVCARWQDWPVHAAAHLHRHLHRACTRPAVHCCAPANSAARACASAAALHRLWCAFPCELPVPVGSPDHV